MSTTTKEIQSFYHRLLELSKSGFTIDVHEDHSKNYSAYTISKSYCNEKYEDCVIIYNGEQGEENATLPNEMGVVEALEGVEGIVNKIKKIFDSE